MNTIDFNLVLKEASELRAKEMQRILSGASTRLNAYGKSQVAALRTHLSRLAQRLLRSNSHTHTYH